MGSWQPFDMRASVNIKSGINSMNENEESPINLSISPRRLVK